MQEDLGNPGESKMAYVMSKGIYLLLASLIAVAIIMSPFMLYHSGPTPFVITYIVVNLVLIFVLVVFGIRKINYKDMGRGNDGQR